MENKGKIKRNKVNKIKFRINCVSKLIENAYCYNLSFHASS